jgi:aminoglycoside phosphotransferase (APT) family kinase protein
LDLDWLAVKEVGPDEVRSKTPSIGVLVDAGLDQIVANDGHLLERTPCGLAHGDLGSRNVLVDHDTLGIVDWGYASIRSVFHDPLHLARGMVFSQRRGVSGKTAMAMAREVLTAWLRASDLPFSPDERKTALQLEHCRSFCADGVAERVAMARPKYAAQLTSLVCDLEI